MTNETKQNNRKLRNKYYGYGGYGYGGYGYDGIYQPYSAYRSYSSNNIKENYLDEKTDLENKDDEEITIGNVNKKLKDFRKHIIKRFISIMNWLDS